MRVGVVGARGRMGLAAAAAVEASSDLVVAAQVDIGDRLDALADARVEVVIDFTHPDSVMATLDYVISHGMHAVVGTTGFTPEQRTVMEKAIRNNVPAVISSNFSVGVNIFWQLVRESGKLLKDYDIEVFEAHHRNKKDAPSGTAKTILEILEEEVGPRPKQYGREGMTERKNEIGVHVIRGGDIVGDHKVMFSKNFETIELSHHASDRSVFASGAVRAARWVVGKKPGIYGMNDVLSLRK